MPRISKNNSDIRKFLECWNIYAGIRLSTDGETSRRMEAQTLYSEMQVCLGKKSVSFAPGIRAEPFFFPIDSTGTEFDYIMGFELYIDNRELGMIRGVTVRGRNVFISTDTITIGFKVGYAEEEI